MKSNGLIKSIIFLVFGALIFAYPNIVITSASIVLGIILILYGIFMIIKNYYETKNNSETPATAMTLGIIIIIFGILFIILSDSISKIFQYVLGAWIIFSGLEKLIMSFTIDKKSKEFVVEIIVASIIVIIGLSTVFITNIPISIIGIIMVGYAILEIIEFITDKKIYPVKDNKDDNKLKINNDNVKEAKVIEEKSSSKKNKK